MIVAFFLQETAGMKPKPGDIPIACDKIIADFSKGTPKVGRQNAVLASALHIKSVVNNYLANPTSPKPFALRCPNLATLKKLSAERGKNPRPLSDTDTNVLLDLYGRMLAIGLPPKRQIVVSPTVPAGQGQPNFETGEVSVILSGSGLGQHGANIQMSPPDFFEPGPRSHCAHGFGKGPPTAKVLWPYDQSSSYGDFFNSLTATRPPKSVCR